MPRVNRDLQRRMAARRERERRRPSERRYQFGPSTEPAPAPDEAVANGAPYDEQVLDTEPEAAAEAAEAREPVDTAPARPGPARRTGAAARSAASPRASRPAVARPAPRPFSAYREEYRYVGSDLRRILLVIGSLLLVLIILSLVLPR